MSSDILVPIKERFWRGKVLISERHCASSASCMVDKGGGMISLIFELVKFYWKWWRLETESKCSLLTYMCLIKKIVVLAEVAKSSHTYFQPK